MKTTILTFVFVFMMAASTFAVTPQEINDYISCLISTGSDTRTLEQPIFPVDGFCKFLALNIALESQSCAQCLQNTMQNLPSSDPGAYGARDACFAGTGVRYSHQGRSGLLILSKRPLTNVQEVNFNTFLIRHPNIYATVSGVRFAFTQWPTNYLFDEDTSLGPLQSGALQPDLAQDVIQKNAQVVLGDFNSGPDYQPAGYNQLVQNKYVPLLSQPTYCPANHATFPPCGDFNAKPTSIDNIFVMKDTGVCLRTTFAQEQASDHIGVAAACLLKAQPGPSTLGLPFTALTLGTWNTMLQPWQPYEPNVEAVLAKTDLDLLVLQEVWTVEAKDRILAAVNKKYPYSYYGLAAQQAGSCPYTPQ